MNKNLLQTILPLLLVFCFVNAFCLTGSAWLAKKEISQQVLISGNLLLAVISIVTFIITHQSVKSENPQAFVRAMYGSFMIKFFVVAIAAFVYIMSVKKNVNKPALILCAGLYIIYTTIEIRLLLKMLKQKKNA
jgi:hypothetical protein